jgi:UDP-N-acetylglucosamine 2-epimerase (non-hydrolysing)
VGTDPDRIVAVAERLLTDPVAHAAMTSAPNPYGDGRAAERIAAAFRHIAFDEPAPAPFGAGFRRSAVLEAAGYSGTFVASTLATPEPADDQEEHEHTAVPP